tara:strand:+ start:7939 stop:9015 length:1077 start_codon:yes stop_codon:yes gene_type:complete
VGKKEKLKKDFDLIIKLICPELRSDIVSIVIYGSYGRSEGAFYEKNGKIFTYNDYDILLVVSSVISHDELLNLKYTLTQKIDVRWIDISQMANGKLVELKPSIFNYDLKYGSKVIWGDQSILNKIRIGRFAIIPASEIEVLYFTRLYTFIGSLSKDAFDNGVKEENSRFFRYQMCKAIFSIIDCELILLNQYSFSYKKKVELISVLKPELNNISRWALEEKLNPSDVSMNGDEVKDLYSSVIEIFRESMFKGISKCYNVEIKSTKRHIFYFYFSRKHVFLLLKGLIKKRAYADYMKFCKLNFAQSYIMECYFSENKLNNYMLNYVHNQLMNYTDTGSIESYDWNESRVALCQFIDQNR